MLSERENYIRNVRRTGPEWIPARVHIGEATWYELGKELEEVCARHPLIFPDFKKGERDFASWKPEHLAGKHRRDPWGCLWEYAYDGLQGQVVEHPLDDWARLEGFQPPDPMKYSDFEELDWPKFRRHVARKKTKGELTCGGLSHGYFLMRLWYLRGFENLMLDIAGDEPRLHQLCDMIVERNSVIIKQFIDARVDVIAFPEDIGTQSASILSPRDFRQWVVPAYKRMMGPVRQIGSIVDTHSDGYIIDLVDDLLECGCDVLNPQDLCNGIDDIARTMKGRCCIKLDVDRQKIVPFGTRKDIHDLIEEEVRKLGSPQGGLSFTAGIWPPTPPENIDALSEALEKFRTYWWD